jgi:hypothetical protein
LDHKNRSPVFDGINRPLRAAHRRYRLRRNNPEFMSALWDFEQQSPAAQLNRIHTAVSIAITKGVSGAIFNDDGHPSFATDRLRGESQTFRRASPGGGLRGSRCDRGKHTCECNTYRPDNRFHDYTSLLRLIEPKNVACMVRR